MPYVKAGRARRGRDYVKTSLTVGVVERALMTDVCRETGETLSGLVERLVRNEARRIAGWAKDAILAEQGRVAAAHQKSIEAALLARTWEKVDRKIEADQIQAGVKAFENPAFERNPDAWSDPNEPRLKVTTHNGVMVGEVTAKGFLWHGPPGTQPASLRETVRQAEAIAATLTPEGEPL